MDDVVLIWANEESLITMEVVLGIPLDEQIRRYQSLIKRSSDLRSYL